MNISVIIVVGYIIVVIGSLYLALLPWLMLFLG